MDRDLGQVATRQVCIFYIFKNSFIHIWIFKTYCEQLIYSDFTQSLYNFRYTAQAQGFGYIGPLGSD